MGVAIQLRGFNLLSSAEARDKWLSLFLSYLFIKSLGAYFLRHVFYYLILTYKPSIGANAPEIV